MIQQLRKKRTYLGHTMSKPLARQLKQEQRMFVTKTTEYCISVAAIAVTLASVLYIHSHIAYGCILGTCAVITH